MFSCLLEPLTLITGLLRGIAYTSDFANQGNNLPKMHIILKLNQNHSYYFRLQNSLQLNQPAIQKKKNSVLHCQTVLQV